MLPKISVNTSKNTYTHPCPNCSLIRWFARWLACYWASKLSLSLIKQDECEVKRCQQPNKRAKKWKLAKWIFIAWPYVKLGGMPHGIQVYVYTFMVDVLSFFLLSVSLCTCECVLRELVSRDMCLYLYMFLSSCSSCYRMLTDFYNRYAKYVFAAAWT